VEKANHTVTLLCEVLEADRSGYYRWAGRKPSARDVRDAELLVQIRAIHAQSKGRYGVPRIHPALRKLGFNVSRKRVARICKNAGIQGIWAKPKHKGAPGPVGKVKNKLKRKFNPKKPGKRLAGDVTYLWAGNRWVYLAVVLDLFNREVKGWAISENVDENLCLTALSRAIKNTKLERKWMMHTDQGATYTAGKHLALVKETSKGRPSMSRRGNCWDNSCVESFFKTLKTELEGPSWANMHDAEMDLFAYIDGFYNRTRLHSTLGYCSPQEYLAQYMAAQKKLVTV